MIFEFTFSKGEYYALSKCSYISFDVVDNLCQVQEEHQCSRGGTERDRSECAAPGFLSLDYAGPKAEPKAEQEEARPEPEEEAYDPER